LEGIKKKTQRAAAPGHDQHHLFLSHTPSSPHTHTQAKICATYGVQRFPTMLVGRAADVAAGAAGKERWSVYDGSLASAAVEAWARTRVAALPAAGDAATAGGGAAGGGAAAAADVQRQHAAPTTTTTATTTTIKPPLSPPSAVDVADITKATALAFQYALQAEAVHGEPGAREAFAAWTSLVAASHPVPACRTGAAALAAALPRAWPPPATAGSLSPPPKPDTTALLAIPVCGPPSSLPAAWGACAPSAALTGTPGGAARATGRGYTCGLWQTFHALAANLPDAESGGTAWMTGVRGYVRHFFQCSECAAHFSEMAVAADAAGVVSRADAVRWAWAAHNRVNARLAGTEAATPGDGDPAHPKVQWPPRSLCPACAAPAPGPDGGPQWDEDAVLSFLLRWYRLTAAGLASSTPRRALGTHETGGAEGSRPLLVLAVVGLVVCAVVLATRPPPVRRGAKAAVC
jgi:thiol oxidase